MQSNDTCPAPTRTLLLTSQQAAEALAICPRNLWSLTKAGEIQCVRIGRLVRYDPVDLQQWINARKGAAR
jgi:excisionase family DNA binding protein